MESKKKKPVRIPIIYSRPDGVPNIYVHGAYGGPTPRGDIHINFYQDKNPLPDAAYIEGVETDDGFEGSQEGIEPPEPAVLREIVAEVFLDPATALNLAEWLRKHAERRLGSTSADTPQL